MCKLRQKTSLFERHVFFCITKAEINKLAHVGLWWHFISACYQMHDVYLYQGLLQVIVTILMSRMLKADRYCGLFIYYALTDLLPSYIISPLSFNVGPYHTHANDSFMLHDCSKIGKFSTSCYYLPVTQNKLQNTCFIIHFYL